MTKTKQNPSTLAQQTPRCQPLGESNIMDPEALEPLRDPSEKRKVLMSFKNT